MTFRRRLKCLLPKQRDRMKAILRAYPEFLLDGEILLDTMAVNGLWHCRSFHVFQNLDRICKRFNDTPEYPKLRYDLLIFARDEDRSEGELRKPNRVERNIMRIGGGRNYQMFRLYLEEENTDDGDN